MNTTAKAYSFIGSVLPDGHLSMPDGVAKGPVKEFEVTMKPVDCVKETMALYIEGRIKKKGRLKNIYLDALAIERAVKEIFGIDTLDSLRAVVV